MIKYIYNFLERNLKMDKTIVKINKVNVKNIKNVKNGEILSPFYNLNNLEQESEIIGIYGQNGSGKTALVNSLNILKCIMGNLKDNESFKDEVFHLINKESNFSWFSYEFSLRKDDELYEAFYEFKIEKDVDDIRIFDEKLSFRGLSPNKINKLTIIETTKDLDSIFLPKTRLENLISKKKNYRTDLIVSRKMAEKENESFIFRKDSIDVFIKGFDNKNFSFIIEELHNFARMNLFVILNDHHSLIHVNMLLPLSFRYQSDEKTLAAGDFPIRFGKNNFEKKEFDLFKGIINQMSKLIHAIIPDMFLELKQYGEVILENGNTGYSVELMSKRNGILIPIKYESDGIKKIISILSSLIAMYNNETICVAVDELDAGIFEYLLGEILKVIKDTGKGQLIFTSHNLRPLEVLNKESIYFTTTNPENRYINFSNIKSNNNLRDVYLRTIDLGGQKECVYKETNEFDIGRAFRMAGKLYEKQS
jgi:AAA15 family ATPase/GTPase